MPFGTTYKQTIKKDGRTFRFVARSYGSTAIQGKSGPEVLKDEAKRERAKGNDVIFTKKVDKSEWGTDYIWYLYSAPKVKKAKKGKK